jgi:hypothetical protein
MPTDTGIPIPLEQLTIPALLPAVKLCIQYCTSERAEAAPSFRSDALSGVARRVFPQSCHTPFSPEMAMAFSDYLTAKLRLVRPQVPFNIRTNLFDPLSLLLVNWRSSLFDGVCTPETYGYIDKDCIPGWDTWVTIVELTGQQDGHCAHYIMFALSAELIGSRIRLLRNTR